MEKVKLPKEMVEFLDGRLRYSLNGYEGMANILRSVPSQFGEFFSKEDTLIKMAEAITYGYEVEEPEFKTGDWVVCANTVFQLFEDLGEWNKEEYRHATPEEIATEKKRRFWAAIDREVNEYRAGDIVIARDGHLMEVRDRNDGLVQCKQHYTNSYDFELFNVYPNSISLVCPVEQRMDTKG